MGTPIARNPRENKASDRTKKELQPFPENNS
jgi:hypothetical protein